MKPPVLPALLFAATVVTHLPANAIMTDQEAADVVERMALQGQPAKRILEYLVDDGRTLEQASVLAIDEAISEQAEAALARAALCMPGASPGLSATLVGAADNAEAVQFAVDTFDPRTCSNQRDKPPNYLDADTPARGGVSPAN